MHPKTSRRRSSRSPSPARRNVTIRRGLISGSGFKASAYKGSDVAFRGRIAVERGSGFVEFPSVTQLPRILREEGIPTSAAEQAFGSGRLKANGKELGPKYGTGRRVKIGHFNFNGTISPGTRKGSLVLMIEQKGKAPAVVWGVVEEPPGVIRNIISNRETTLKSVITKAASLGMPMQSIHDAFRHLMSKTMQNQMVASFHASRDGGTEAELDEDGEEGGYEGL